MPPRRQMQRQARPSGFDPTASITAAAGAKSAMLADEQEVLKEESQKEAGANDDLKKLIETLKNKLNTNGAQQKKAPPTPTAKTVWNRSVVSEEKSFNSAYTVLTRISNHEKVPAKSTKQTELTTKGVPDSFIFRPGADGIKIDNLNIKAGKQIGLG